MATTKITKFERGTNRGTQVCIGCGKRTWASRIQNGTLCDPCFDRAGAENSVADGNMTCAEFLAEFGQHSEYCNC